MARPNQHGFTLIELILVIAITGALLMIAFAGQGQLRAQAQFDATVNKIVSSIADAHNEATAAVNVNGAGNGESSCTADSGSEFVFAGVAWVASGPGDVRMDFYKAVPQSSSASDSCIFTSSQMSFPSPIRINIANPPASQGGRELFVRSNDVLNICPVTDNSVNVANIFRSGSCADGSLVLTITDDQGRRGQVTVDKSGLAHRDF